MSSTSSEIQGFNKPLNEYFIRSSHNSYSLAFSDLVPELGSLAKFLDNGFRAIEIDVFENDEKEILVAHHRINMGVSVKFTQMLQEVKNWHDSHPSHLPIIVNLDITHRSKLRKLGIFLKRLVFIKEDSLGTKVTKQVQEVFGEDEIVQNSQIIVSKQGLTWPVVDTIGGKILFGMHRQFFNQVGDPALKNLIIDDDSTYCGNYNFEDIQNEPVKMAKLIQADMIKQKLIRVYPAFHPFKTAFKKVDDINFKTCLDLGVQMIGTDMIKEGEEFFKDKSYIPKSEYVRH